jgi:NAD(P)H-dependent FMN reductase
MPPLMISDGKYGNELTDAWSKKIASLDAFVLVTPEYNHGTSAVLKNALDQVSREWNKKPVGFVSHGAASGIRAVEQLRLVVVNLGMVGVNNAVHINGAGWNLLDETGALKAGVLDQYAHPTEGMLDDIAWWGNALKVARNA